MFDFYQRRKLRAVLNSPITQGVLILLAVGVAWSAYERYEIAVKMAERRHSVEAQASALETRRAELEEQVRYLESERGIEAEMRRQFDVALDGEQVVIIVDNETPDTAFQPLPEMPATSSPPKPWYRFW